MSTSDDQLDALYKSARHTDPGLQSPEDLDAAIRAAAANATTDATRPDESAVLGRSSWASRYGWATAATLLLTTTLFLALPDANLTDTPEFAPVLNKQTTDRSQAPMAHAPAEADIQSSLTETADRPISADVQASPSEHTAPTIGADQAPGQFATPIAAAAESESPSSPQRSPSIVATPAPSMTPPPLPPQPTVARHRTALEIPPPTTADATSATPKAGQANADLAPSADLSHRKIEEIVVTGHRVEAPACATFEGLLIDQLCEVPATAKRSRSATDTLSAVREFRLFAAAQTPCAGQSLNVQTQADSLTLHDTSSKRRAVLLESSGDSAAEPTQEVICKFGRLKVQSLARGR